MQHGNKLLIARADITVAVYIHFDSQDGLGTWLSADQVTSVRIYSAVTARRSLTKSHLFPRTACIGRSRSSHAVTMNLFPSLFTIYTFFISHP